MNNHLNTNFFMRLFYHNHTNKKEGSLYTITRYIRNIRPPFSSKNTSTKSIDPTKIEVSVHIANRSNKSSTSSVVVTPSINDPSTNEPLSISKRHSVISTRTNNIIPFDNNVIPFDEKKN